MATYGNYILKSWSEFIAESAIGRMAVQSRCSTNRVVALLVKIDPPEKNLDFRLTILNEEAPHRFSRPTNLQDAIRSMERQWQSHYFAACHHYGRDFTGRVLDRGFAEVKDDPPEYAFYCEDANQRYNTIRSRWSKKKHYEVCVVGMCSTLLDEIKRVLLFRSKIKDFPAPPPGAFSNDDIEWKYLNTIRDLWDPYAKEYGHIAVGRILINFYYGGGLDYDTWQLALERKGVYGPTDVP